MPEIGGMAYLSWGGSKWIQEKKVTLKLTKKAPVQAEHTTQIKDHGQIVSEKSESLNKEAAHDFNKSGESQMTGMSMAKAELGNSEPYCEVGVTDSYTHNLGNFKSCRHEVSIKVPCILSEVDNAHDFCEQWVDSKLSPIAEQLQKDFPG